MKKVLTIFLIFKLLIHSSCSLELDELDTLPCTTFDTCGCNEFEIVDERDGRIYQTVWIDEDGGNDTSKPGKCWMKDPLNVGEQVFSSSSVKRDNIIQKYCYNGDCETYGGYYPYDEAIAYDPNVGQAEENNYNVRGVCPKGWHLPSKTEFEALVAASGGNVNSFLQLRTNELGLDIGLGGFVFPFGQELESKFEGQIGYLRSYSSGDSNRVYILMLDVSGSGLVRVNGDVSGGGGTLPEYGLCIRCIMD